MRLAPSHTQVLPLEEGPTLHLSLLYATAHAYMHFCYLDRLNDWYMELMSSQSSFVSGYSSLLRL